MHALWDYDFWQRFTKSEMKQMKCTTKHELRLAKKGLSSFPGFSQHSTSESLSSSPTTSITADLPLATSVESLITLWMSFGFTSPVLIKPFVSKMDTCLQFLQHQQPLLDHPLLFLQHHLPVFANMKMCPPPPNPIDLLLSCTDQLI